MLIRRSDLERIVSGEITLVFRRWRRPTVKTGGSLTTRAGVLAIGTVERIPESSISAADARRAGYASRQELLAALGDREHTDVYRIEVHLAGTDPRIDLRRTEPDDAAVQTLKRRLARLDQASSGSPWTAAVLASIRDHEGRRAADLAAAMGVETQVFKRNVRKLKNLGLTESLEVGYRLSPRGRVLLERIGD